MKTLSVVNNKTLGVINKSVLSTSVANNKYMISFTNLIKTVLTIYANNLKSILAILAVTTVWNLAIRIIPVSLATTFNFMIPVAVITIIISAFTELALVKTLANILQNEQIRIGAILAEALKKLPWFMVLVIFWAIIILIGSIFMVIPAIIFAVWFMFLTPILMIENMWGFKIFKQSKHLVSGHFFPLLLRAGIITALSLAIVVIASQGFNSIVNAVSPPTALPYLNTISSIFNALLLILFLPIISGTTVVLYYEMKKIKG